MAESPQLPTPAQTEPEHEPVHVHSSSSSQLPSQQHVNPAVTNCRFGLFGNSAFLDPSSWDDEILETLLSPDFTVASHELPTPSIGSSATQEHNPGTNTAVSDSSQSSSFGDSVQTATPMSAPALHASTAHPKDPPQLGRTSNIRLPSPSARPGGQSTGVPQQNTPVSSVELRNPTAERGGTSWHGPLHIAAQRGHGPIVHLLLKHTVDCNELDSDGRTPLYYAIKGGFEGIVTTLTQHGARIDQVDNQKRNALHWAVAERREGPLRLLLEHCKQNQSLINSYDIDGMTPLHAAVDAGFEAGVDLLLQHGADLDYKARKI